MSGGNVEHGLDVARIEDKLAVILLHLRSNTCIVHSELPKLDKMLASCFRGGSVAEWLACWTQAQKGPGSNRSRDAVG